VPAAGRLASQAFVERARFPSRLGPGLLDQLDAWPGWNLVALTGDELVGLLICRIPQPKEVAGIAWIATYPAWQSRGIGGALLAAFEAKARAERYRRIAIGTPYAAPFYRKHGYREVEPIFRLIREVAGKTVPAPSAAVRIIDLDDLDRLLVWLPADRQPALLRSFLGAYEREQDKAIELVGESGPAAVLIGETDPHARDLIRPLFVHAVPGALRALLDGFAWLGSKKGNRWVAYEPASAAEAAQVRAWGWEEAHLPSWFTAYRFEKDLA